MKFYLFVIILFFLSQETRANYLENDTLNVLAMNGLKIRSAISTKGKKLALSILQIK